jgi:hypothetical protein
VPGAGRNPEVQVYDGANGALLTDFIMPAPGYTGGLFVAAGDVNGDGINDVVISQGAGSPIVFVYNGATFLTTHSQLGNFMGLPSTYHGCEVAVGDLNNDGFADIVCSAASSSGTDAPLVQVLNGNGFGLVRSFNAFSTSFTGGVSVAVGDFNGDGHQDIITGEGPSTSGSSMVTVYDGTNVFGGGTLGVLANILPYGATYHGGVWVATKSEAGADTGRGDQVDIIIGSGANNPARQVLRAKWAGVGQAPSISVEQTMSAVFAGGMLVA